MYCNQSIYIAFLPRLDDVVLTEMEGGAEMTCFIAVLITRLLKSINSVIHHWKYTYSWYIIKLC